MWLDPMVYLGSPPCLLHLPERRELQQILPLLPMTWWRTGRFYTTQCLFGTLPLFLNACSHSWRNRWLESGRWNATFDNVCKGEALPLDILHRPWGSQGSLGLVNSCWDPLGPAEYYWPLDKSSLSDYWPCLDLFQVPWQLNSCTQEVSVRQP